jgi:hypothetical protein
MHLNQPPYRGETGVPEEINQDLNLKAPSKQFTNLTWAPRKLAFTSGSLFQEKGLYGFRAGGLPTHRADASLGAWSLQYDKNTIRKR